LKKKNLGDTEAAAHKSN